MLSNIRCGSKRFAALLVCMVYSLGGWAQAPSTNAGTAGGQAPAVDPSVYDGYAGHYKFNDTLVMTISRDGNRLLTQMTGQGSLEITPNSKTEFTAQQVNARISFVVDAQGRATALRLQQGPADVTAPRIDDQQAAQIEQQAKKFRDAIDARVKSQMPMPGSEAALRRLYQGMITGMPNYDEMAPGLAAAARQQNAQLQASAQNLGAIQSVKFQNVTPQGMDAYEVQFEHGTATMQILLSPDGKIQGALFGGPPVAVPGAPKAEPGPYQASSEPAFGVPGLKVFHPEALDRIGKPEKLPIVVWGNGGCTYDTPAYASLLLTIASHGFVVVTTAGRPAGGAVRDATAKDLVGAIDWAERENRRAASPLNGKIDTKHVAVMGQSCGGGLAIELGADPRVATIGVFNYGITDSSLKALHGPVLLINGHESDFMMGPSKAMYDAIGNLPVFYGALHGVGHIGTVMQPGGGEFANVASNWALWKLKGDQKAAGMFMGPSCGLCSNKNWDVAAKRLN